MPAACAAFSDSEAPSITCDGLQWLGPLIGWRSAGRALGHACKASPLRGDLLVRYHAVGLNPRIPLTEHILELAVRGPESMMDGDEDIVVVFHSAALVTDIDVRGAGHCQMNADLVGLSLVMAVLSLGYDNPCRRDALIDVVKARRLLPNSLLKAFGPVDALKGNLKLSLHGCSFSEVTSRVSRFLIFFGPTTVAYRAKNEKSYQRPRFPIRIFQSGATGGNPLPVHPPESALSYFEEAALFPWAAVDAL